MFIHGSPPKLDDPYSMRHDSYGAWYLDTTGLLLSKPRTHKRVGRDYRTATCGAVERGLGYWPRCEAEWKSVNCPACLALRPAEKVRKPTKYSRDHEGVAAAWRDNVRWSASNMGTDGKVVWSYSHRIGFTSDTGEKVAHDCHASSSTAAHSGYVKAVSDRRICCPCGVAHHSLLLLSLAGEARLYQDRHENGAHVNLDRPRFRDYTAEKIGTRWSRG